MRIDYAIRFEDFRALYPPYQPSLDNQGFRALTLVSMAFGSGGALYIYFKQDWMIGSVFLGMGLATFLIGLIFERKNVAESKTRAQQEFRNLYRQVHCRDRRFMEAGKGTVGWADVTGFREDDASFTVISVQGSASVPKSAFTSGAQQTEFRNLLSSHVQPERGVGAASIEFYTQARDRRQGYWLNVYAGGGWKTLGSQALTFAIAGYGCISILGRLDGAVRASILVPVAIFAFWGMSRPKAFRYHGLLRLQASREELVVQDEQASVKNSWDDFIGFVEDEHVMLLYYNPNLYRVIPKRAFPAANHGFPQMVRSRLRVYNYKRPFRKF
jgi:hypothetical protein